MMDMMERMERKNFGRIQKIINRLEEGAFLVVKGKEKTNVVTIGGTLARVMWRRLVMMVAVRMSC